MKKRIAISIFFLSIIHAVVGQTLSETQMRNARATGYAIVASRNPGKSFTIYMIPWDGVNTLEYNANAQINSGWHAQAAIKGNYLNQSFNDSDFSQYSSVVVSQAEFDLYKSTGIQWWIVCSVLPPFSNSGDLSLGVDGGISTISGPSNSGAIQIKTNSSIGGSANRYLRLGWKDNNAAFSPALSVNDDLNVGIGTISPENRLEIFGSTFNRVSANVNANVQTGYQVKRTGSTYATDWEMYSPASSTDLRFFNGGDRLTLMSNGNVGIGTTTPDAKLAVKGTVHAQEVKVDLNVPGPDYVFEENYNLPSLTEIETYIKQNKHLPEVPSAKEMEANGINLSEMNMLLLKKVEELTLHMIELKKRDEAQQKEIEKLKRK